MGDDTATVFMFAWMLAVLQNFYMPVQSLVNGSLLCFLSPDVGGGGYRTDPRPSVCASVRPSFRPSDFVPATHLTPFIGQI